MKTQFWRSYNPREFKSGDIICERDDQSHTMIVLDINEDALWCIGLVHCALTVNHKVHPIFPIWFEWIDNGIQKPLARLGNLNDFSAYVCDKDIQEEVKQRIEYFKSTEES